jgi:mannosyltransferase OCH1-like enzyme
MKSIEDVEENVKIPKIIHQIWIGPKKAPDFMHTWKDNHPEYEYILWDEERIKKDMYPLANQHLYDLYDFEGSNVWNGKSNLLRIEIMKKYGGIYADADCISLRPLEGDFLNNEIFFEYANEIMRKGIVAWGVMGSIPNHPLFDRMINKLNQYKKIIQPSHIFNGPTFLTKCINENPMGIRILPSYYFLPKFYKDNHIADYRGDFKPFSDHVWGQTKGLYGTI